MEVLVIDAAAGVERKDEVGIRVFMYYRGTKCGRQWLIIVRYLSL